MSDELEVLNLDAAREARAAQREGKKKPLPIIILDETICELPVELPLTVLTPLRKIDDTIALLIRQAMTLATNKDAGAKWEASEMVVNMLASDPDLPLKVVEVIEEVSNNLLTETGVEKFMAAGPSVDDIKALANGIMRHYGVSLGEALPSSDSSTDGGGTSLTTSSTNSDSTPEVSGPTQEPLAS